MTFKNIMMIVEYDGTNFCGFQIQQDRRSVQQCLEGAIFKLTGKRARIICAGRTDAGVHANFQVVNFLTTSKIRADKFHYHLLKYLPDDINILDSKQMDIYFHSRFSTKKKTYKYLINTQKHMHPMYRNYMEHITYPLNYEILKEAIAILKGKHDFKAFMLYEKDVIINTVRTIDDIYFSVDDGILTITYEAESFLHNQVRIMTGTLIECARGKITLDELESYFDKDNTKKAGPTVKSGGLYLDKIEFLGRYHKF